ncbi:MAG: hypothetical protein Q8P25_03965 [Candidatus Curtissbacteria bacterium]|nr:hypothetical protein [Candidatus Curtissbacteria bacterium]
MEHLLYQGNPGKQVPQSTGELLNQIRHSARIGEQRSLRKDAGLYLQLEGITPHYTYLGRPDPSLLTILVPNHYGRGQLARRSIFSTGESFKAITLTTHGAQVGEINWLMKEMNPFKIPIPRKDRQTQNASAITHGNITLKERETYTEARIFIETLSNALRSSGNIGVFPNLRPSAELEDYYKGFLSILKRLKKHSFQIWPVSINAPVNKHYFVLFGRPIVYVQNMPVEELAESTMVAIARGISPESHSSYRRVIAQAPQQQASDQIPLPEELQAN